jgi:FMN phosphatase YigB (HAD superfamily)
MMVGDSFKQDIEGARRIGMHAVLVNRSSALDPRSEIDGVPVIQSLTELLRVLGF